jgi:hypothetical protein
MVSPLVPPTPKPLEIDATAQAQIDAILESEEHKDGKLCARGMIEKTVTEADAEQRAEAN